MFRRLLGTTRPVARPVTRPAAPDDDWAIGFDAFLSRQFGKERRPRTREALLRQEFKCFVAGVVEPVFADIWDRLGSSDRSVQIDGQLDPDGGSATQYVVLVFTVGGKKEFWYRLQYQSDTDRLSITCTGAKGSGGQAHLENLFCPQICRDVDHEPRELGFRQITQDDLTRGVSAAYLAYKGKN
jgi:hypothetical protein